MPATHTLTHTHTHTHARVCARTQSRAHTPRDSLARSRTQAHTRSPTRSHARTQHTTHTQLNGDAGKACRHLAERAALRPGDAGVWFDYGAACIRLRDLAKVARGGRDRGM